MRFVPAVLLSVTLGCSSDSKEVVDAAPSPPSDAAPSVPDARPPDAAPAPAASMSFFVSSEGGSGNLGGLAGADMRCQRLAAAVGMGGKTWRAYLSSEGTGAVDARDRIGSGPWHNFAGVKIADNLAGLHDQEPASTTNNLRQATALDEQGRVIPGRPEAMAGGINQHDILTGSDAEGRVMAGGTCSSWTSAAAGHARVGHSDRLGLDDTVVRRSWNSAHDSRGLAATPDDGCSHDAFRGTGGDGRIYCFATN